MIGYGLGRMFIETLRTDQLLLWNTTIPVSVVISAFMAFLGVLLMLIFGIRAHREKQKVQLASETYAPEASKASHILDDLMDDPEIVSEADLPSEKAAEQTASEDASSSGTEKKKPEEDDLWD